jgi:hypothetical protein
MSKPAHKLYDGVLQVAIWRNSGEKGSWYSITYSRSYRDGDETWKQTDSLNADDCLPMAELIREAYAWIKMQRRADAKARKESERATPESEQAAA